MEASDSIFIKKNQSPYKVNKELLVRIGEVLIIEAGSVIEVGEGALIAGMGSIIANGNPDDPIIIRRLDDEWRIIRMLREADSLVLNYVHIENGSIYSLECDVKYLNCQFRNTRQLDWNQSISSNHGGSLLIDNCSISGNDTGEGFLCHNMIAPIIQNCKIEQTPDGIELIECKNGLINNNYISDASDDAIDLNSCQNVVISNNTISHISNRGIEIGHTAQGPTVDVIIKGNNISDSHTGLHLMQKTEAEISNNTFTNNVQNILLTELYNKSSPQSITIYHNTIDSNDAYIVADTSSHYHSEENIISTPIKNVSGSNRILFYITAILVLLIAIYSIKRYK